MAQLPNVPGGNYAKELDPYIQGQILDARYSEKESFRSVDPNDIDFGLGLVAGQGEDFDGVRLPRLNRVELSVDADLGASNSTIITVNGNATTATVYDSSHAATMDAIAEKVAALEGVLSCTVDARKLIITGKDVDVTASGETTGGSAKVWTASAATSVDTVRGLAVLALAEQTIPTPSQPSQAIPYRFKNTVTVLRKGVLIGKLASTLNNGVITPGESAYIVTAAGADRGKLTNVSAGNLLIGTFRMELDHNSFGGAQGGLAPVQVLL